MREQGAPTTIAAKELRATLIIFIGVTALVFLFLLAAIFIVQSLGPLKPGWNEYFNLLKWGFGILSAVVLVFARQVFHKSIGAAKNSLILAGGKLSHHRTALVKYLGICEFAAILNIVLFIFTGESIFIIIAAVVLGFMLAMAPTPRRVAMLLELDATEEQELKSR